MPTPVRPAIVIPGIKGSSLQNFYPLDPVEAWSTTGAVESQIFGPDFHALALDEHALIDLAPDVLMRPYQALAIAYGPLVRSLRGHTIDAQHVPAYVFPYDWRYSIARSGAALGELVTQVVAKTTRHPPAGWDGKVNVVCHSMGGLVLRAWLAQTPAEWKAPLGRVVFVATPHLGSLDAVEMMVRGETSLLGGEKEMRKLARTFPSVYELLPRSPHAVVRKGAGGAAQDVDLWELSNWQENVTPTPVPDANGFDVEQEHLDAAWAILDALPLPTARGVAKSDVLTIYGSRPNSTLREVQLDANAPPNPPANWLDFDHATKTSGDEVVPDESAKLAGQGIAAIQIAWDDVGYFAIRARYGNLHAFLPTLDEVGTIVSRFFAGQSGTDLLPLGIPHSRFQANP